MKQLWIKICGLSTVEAVDAALGCEVDAIGFVFAASVRQIAPAKAAALAAHARGRVRCIAVMRHPTQAELDLVLADFKPDILQTDIEDFDALRMPAQLERLPVLRAGDHRSPLPPRLLFEGAASGSGLKTDWGQAARVSRHCELILAGGLTPENVANAIGQVQPFGVDVSSGVEIQPGIKSAAKIAAFVAAARGEGRILQELAR